MAQWGQGDPRWIVEHRNDGKNVNGWHWEEKSILSQVKARLGEMFDQVPVQVPTGQQLLIKGCNTITGEASISTRKGNKRLVVYDLKVTVDWQLTPQDPAATTVSGTMRVEEFASASDEEDYVVEVTVVGTGKEEDAAKQLFESYGRPKVIRRLVELAQELQNIPGTGTGTPEPGARDSPAPGQ